MSELVNIRSISGGGIQYEHGNEGNKGIKKVIHSDRLIILVVFLIRPATLRLSPFFLHGEVFIVFDELNLSLLHLLDEKSPLCELCNVFVAWDRDRISDNTPDFDSWLEAYNPDFGSKIHDF